MDPERVLEVRALRSRISENLAIEVSGVTLARGETLAILGANGSGKTAFLEALLGLRACQARDVDLLGVAAARFDDDPNARLRFGVQLQQIAFRYDSLVMDLIRLRRALYGPGNGAAWQLLRIGALAPKRYGQLSGGERRRVDLFMALAHAPALIVLDEPTAALDQSFAAALRAHLGVLREHSGMVVVTHGPEDVVLADKVLWLERGRVVAYESPANLLASRLGHYRAEIRLGPREDAARWRAEIDSIPEIRAYWGGSGAVLFGGNDLEGQLRRLVDRHPVQSYAFAQSSAADLLWLTSRGTA